MPEVQVDHFHVFGSVDIPVEFFLDAFTQRVGRIRFAVRDENLSRRPLESPQPGHDFSGVCMC